MIPVNHNRNRKPRFVLDNRYGFECGHYRGLYEGYVVSIMQEREPDGFDGRWHHFREYHVPDGIRGRVSVEVYVDVYGKVMVY